MDEAKKNKPHPRGYGAPEGSKRDRQLDATKADLASGDPKRVKRAYARRERMEKAEREKPGWKNRPRPDTKKESEDLDESVNLLRQLIAEALISKVYLHSFYRNLLLSESYSNADVAVGVFVMRSPVCPPAMKYDHIGFVLSDGSLKDMSGHRYDGDVPRPPMKYSFNDVEELFDMPSSKAEAAKLGVYKEKRLRNPVDVPDSVPSYVTQRGSAVNCGSFVKVVLKNAGVDVPRSNRIEDIWNAIR